MTISKQVIINGSNLDITSLLEIASGNTSIVIDKQVEKKLKITREIALKTNQRVYGLNTGVGQNKDLNISKEQLSRFNLNLIKSHSISMGDPLPEKVCRLTFLIRINQLLKGYTGINPKIVRFLVKIFNLGISPVLYSCGSIGEADIGILSSIGSLMTNEGKVWYESKQEEVAVIFKQNEITAPVLGPKDGLSLVSSNAYGVAQEIVGLERTKAVFRLALKVFGLAAEGFDANVTPISEEPAKALNNEYYRQVIEQLKIELKGSYLFINHTRKQLQDPISFRSAVHVFSTIMHILQICSENVNQWLKSSDDNPIINIETEEIISTGNFEVVDLSLFLETLNQSLVHLSRIVFQQIKHLNNDQFTGLPRFLIEQQGSEFGLQTLQKLAMDMDIRIRQLARPVSIEFYGLAGDIEDHNSNLPLIGETTQKINEYLISIIAIELYNAEQAVYLRLKNNKGLSLGTGTKKLYEEVRQLIKPIKEDRKYGFEIEELIRQIKDRI